MRRLPKYGLPGIRPRSDVCPAAESTRPGMPTRRPQHRPSVWIPETAAWPTPSDTNADPSLRDTARRTNRTEHPEVLGRLLRPSATTDSSVLPSRGDGRRIPEELRRIKASPAFRFVERRFPARPLSDGGHGSRRIERRAHSGSPARTGSQAYLLGRARLGGIAEHVSRTQFAAVGRGGAPSVFTGPLPRDAYTPAGVSRDARTGLRLAPARPGRSPSREPLRLDAVQGPGWRTTQSTASRRRRTSRSRVHVLTLAVSSSGRIGSRRWTWSGTSRHSPSPGWRQVNRRGHLARRSGRRNGRRFTGSPARQARRLRHTRRTAARDAAGERFAPVLGRTALTTAERQESRKFSPNSRI